MLTEYRQHLSQALKLSEKAEDNHLLAAVAAVVAEGPECVANVEDCLMILQLMRDDIILWQGEISRGERARWLVCALFLT